MKKNLPFSFLVLLIVFAGIPCNTSYQSQSFHYKTYCINNNVQKKAADVFENLIADKLRNKESYDMIISLSQPGDQYKEDNKISDEMPAKQTSDVNAIFCGHNHKFFDNLFVFEYKKGYGIIADQAGQVGLISDRLDFEFTKFSGRNLAKYHTISVSQKTEG
ncbi:MAG TPA: hypothetical protein VKB95_02085 [Chitinophagaceae bacterium]|nr:hypothetical protein [Chitinophagaceae bacterium]